MNKTSHLPSRFAAIDALRGIAALLVVWQHVAESFVQIPSIAQNGTFLADISKQIDFGRIGIICFFLISGYVIPSSLTGNNRLKAIKKFSIRRFFRLYPAYWVSLALIIVLYQFIHVPVENSTILANTTMLQSFFGKNHMIGLYWTLQVELLFYTLCVLLFYGNKLNDAFFVFMLLVVLFVFFVIEQYLVNYTTLIHWSKEFQFLPYLLCVMLLGSLYRKVEQQGCLKSLKKYSYIGTFLCLGLPFFLLISSLLGFHLATNAFRFGIAHTLAFLVFFIGIRYLKHAPKSLLWLGMISYSLYLFHPFVLYGTKFLIENSSFLILKSQHLFVYLLIVGLLSIVLAALVYYVVEKPMIRFSKSC